MDDASGTPQKSNTPSYRRPSVHTATKILASAALLTLVGTYVAAQTDLVRRYVPGKTPAQYLLPQARRIWLPGVAASLGLAVAALSVHRASRR